ncbi:MAG TPA: DUF1289 domain-containing protein [Rhizomicrobium sp.]|jgi:hypothetical protein|nr:DUF1289 domain-containing protein [Rhizomicrobium sp.]
MLLLNSEGSGSATELMETAIKMIESPCIRVCTIDTVSGLCIGCGRTLDEIARWSSFSGSERLAIMRCLRERLVEAELVSTPARHDEMT